MKIYSWENWTVNSVQCSQKESWSKDSSTTRSWQQTIWKFRSSKYLLKYFTLNFEKIFNISVSVFQILFLSFRHMCKLSNSQFKKLLLMPCSCQPRLNYLKILNNLAVCFKERKSFNFSLNLVLKNYFLFLKSPRIRFYKVVWTMMTFVNAFP